MLESIGELPSHPLFVHAPVVLMPLVTIFALALLARPTLRRQVGFALPILSAGLAIATYLTMESGHRLKGLLGDFAPNTDKHESLATTTLILVLLLTAAGAATAVVDRRARTASGPTRLAPIATALIGLSTILAGLATIWMFRAGHEGARLVWKGTVQSMAAIATA